MKDTLRSLLKRGRSDRRISLQISLGLLVAVCAVPAIVVCAYLLYNNFELKRAAMFRSAELISREIVSNLDRELSGIESGLRVLATSESLAKGDLKTFYNEAQNALKSQVVYNYILTDREGKQIINTLRPFGAPLPTTGTPPALAAVFTDVRTVLTDLFIGPVTKKPALAMGVPVTGDDGKVVYSLNIGLDPTYLTNMLKRHNAPKDWLVAIIDNSGTIVARSREAERYVGQLAVANLVHEIRTRNTGTLETQSKEGIPVATAFVHSQSWGWTAVTGAPRAQLDLDVWRTTGFAAFLLLVGLALGSAAAYFLAHQVLSSVHFLNNAALALRDGKPLKLPPVQLKEAEAVGAAIVQASHLMAEVQHRATHDSLTNLGNREMFFAVGEHQLAEARRSGRPLALLSIDLDNFKQVNDNEGHAAGDLLLKGVSERINKTIRASDVAVRMGGDEFSVLLVGADADIAATIASRLVEELAQPFGNVKTPTGSSIGIAVYPASGKDLSSLMEAADRTLYEVKRSGRNGFAMALPTMPARTFP